MTAIHEFKKIQNILHSEEAPYVEFLNAYSPNSFLFSVSEV